jgi:hypothetical protein
MIETHDLVQRSGSTTAVNDRSFARLMVVPSH